MTRTVVISLELHEWPTLVVEFLQHGVLQAVSKYATVNLQEVMVDVTKWLEDGEL